MQRAGHGLVLNFDGSILSNPGGACGWGWTLSYNQSELAGGWGSQAPAPDDVKAEQTVNTAEYSGLIAGISYLVCGLENDRNFLVRHLLGVGCLEAPGKLLVHGDSKLVLHQVTGNWKCRHDHLLLRLREVKRLCTKLRANFELPAEFAWVPRDSNARADELSKLGSQAGDGSDKLVRGIVY